MSNRVHYFNVLRHLHSVDYPDRIFLGESRLVCRRETIFIILEQNVQIVTVRCSLSIDAAKFEKLIGKLDILIVSL
jgi:hypothetical protein